MDSADDLDLRLGPGPGPGYRFRQQQQDDQSNGGTMIRPRLDLNAPPPCCEEGCVGIDEEEGRGGLNEGFEWEAIIIDGGILEEGGEMGFDQEHDPWNDLVEWEALLGELLFDGDDAEGFAYTNSDFEELTADQFHDSAARGNPPAARSAVEGLPSFVLSREDGGCAVCNEEMGEGEKGRRLPCTHRYHEDCILRWLEMRNTCPLCRHELPTDDPVHEIRRARMTLRDANANANASVGALDAAEDWSIMHDFDMLPEA